MPTALLLDLGNVIIDIDHHRTREAFRQLLGEHYEELLTATRWQEWHRSLELGQISQEAFINRIQKTSPLPLQGDQVARAWNATLIGIPPRRIELLQALRKDYRLFLLSNTDAIHMDWIRRYVQRTFGIPDFDRTLFEQAFFSYAIGHRKPESESYQHVLQATGLPPQDFLFIDDRLDNVEGARAVGIPSVQHLVGEELEETLKKAERDSPES